MRGPATLVAVLALASPVQAGLSKHDLSQVRIAPAPGAHLPLSLTFRDLDGRSTTLGSAIGGRPALLLPVDYTCRSICSPALEMAAAMLRATGLKEGDDYRLIAVGFDPGDGIEDARAMLARLGDPALARAARILVGDEASIAVLKQSLGYQVAYDAEHDEFAHPAAAVALEPDGTIARVLSSLGLNPDDLRLALADAGANGLAGQLAMLCYRFDPEHGVYALAIDRLLKAAAGLGLIALTGVLGLLRLRERAS